MGPSVAATTKIAPEVFESMIPYLTDLYGNPSSAYRFGKQINGAIEHAREQVALLLGCEPKEVLFTSCGTESDNAAISSAFQTTGKRQLLTSAVEHSAVKNHAEKLENSGFGVLRLPVAADGTLTPCQVEKAVTDDTAIVSLMWANNETGVLFPVEEIASLCHDRGVLFHTDAVQVAGKIPLDLSSSKITMLSLSGHKLHAPKGVGALYLKRRSKFAPYLIGGSQEKGKRAGTENVASIVGFGRAAELALEKIGEERTRVKAMRDRFEEALLADPRVKVNGNREDRLPNTSNLRFEGKSAEHLIGDFDALGLCASAGSACTTGSMAPSHVLNAMGLSDEQALSSIRFSFSRYNTQEEADRAIRIVKETFTG